ncbi:MAG: hypothetical protein KDI49_12935, partial [Gammaproteobacteria bacterium]|nr:hypothetical protein [Gammaproteobacteria bacterium]
MPATDQADPGSGWVGPAVATPKRRLPRHPACHRSALVQPTDINLSFHWNSGIFAIKFKLLSIVD